jgi:hypothetical protein
MVELVLGDPRRHALEVERDVCACRVLALQPHGDWALDWDGDALHGEAALVVGGELVTRADELRVDEHRDLVLPGNEHEHPPEDADLGRRQPDAVRVLHQLGHASRETPQVVVELLDGASLHAQDRVRILPDLSQREPTPRELLGIELLVPDLSLNLFLSLCHSGHTSDVERREREAIMRQGVSRPETPRDRTEREALVEDLKGNPLAGLPIRHRLRNFRPDAAAQLAALGGPLAWMRRLRAIEIAVGLHERQLAEAWESLHDAYRDDEARFARVWRELAERWDFHEVNELIERHNRHYPAESRLPMNPRTGDFVLVNGKPYTRIPLDANWILARFPAG